MSDPHAIRFESADKMAAIDDLEIRETVESLLGKGIRVLDVEKNTQVKNEEVLLINGTPVPLVGEEGDVIRQALLSGTAPPIELLNQLLISAGIWRHPVRVETSLTVKNTTLNKDTVVVSKNGVVVDERVRETKEEDVIRSSSTEIWRAVPRPIPPTTQPTDPPPPAHHQQPDQEDSNDQTVGAATIPAAGCDVVDAAVLPSVSETDQWPCD